MKLAVTSVSSSCWLLVIFSLWCTSNLDTSSTVFFYM